LKTKYQKLEFNNKHYFWGIFHIHSRFSHDGKNTIREIAVKLKENNIKFCVITDHFEDFTEKEHNTYLSEIKSINEEKETIFIPGIEAQVLNSHVIFFPVYNYNQIYKVVNQEESLSNSFIKVVAHPTKNSISDLKELSSKYNIDGIEIWNQQTDGNYIPSVNFIEKLLKEDFKVIPNFYFGCDLHNKNYRINNFIYIKFEDNIDINTDYIIQKLRSGKFINFNQKSEIFLKGNSNFKDLLYCISNIEKKTFIHGIIFYKLRSVLKLIFEILPKNIRSRLNDLKNFVRSKI